MSPVQHERHIAVWCLLAEVGKKHYVFHIYIMFDKLFNNLKIK